MPDNRTVTAHGCTIPSIGYGTWTLKGEAGAEAVGWALASGYRHLDTARMYDNEEAVGQGLKAAKLAAAKIIILSPSVNSFPRGAADQKVTSQRPPTGQLNISRTPCLRASSNPHRSTPIGSSLWRLSVAVCGPRLIRASI